MTLKLEDSHQTDKTEDDLSRSELGGGPHAGRFYMSRKPRRSFECCCFAVNERYKGVKQ